MSSPTRSSNDLLNAKIKSRDSSHLDPSERAELVNQFIFNALGLTDSKDTIKHPLYWDLLSYCVEMINLYAFAQAQSSVGEDAQVFSQQFMQATKLVNNLFHSIHYSLPDGSPELGPSRKDHEDIWAKRMEDYI